MSVRLTFSPLYLGVLTATDIHFSQPCNTWRFQSPLPRGSHCNRERGSDQSNSARLSVPSTSGFSLQPPVAHQGPGVLVPFSPLYLGVLTATTVVPPDAIAGPEPFSPLYLGVLTATTEFVG